MVEDGGLERMDLSREEIAEMDAKARAYAQRIDEASAFQDQLDKAVAHVRGSSGSP